ncbi:probetacellulin [Festucalex cinctus]
MQHTYKHAHTVACWASKATQSLNEERFGPRGTAFCPSLEFTQCGLKFQTPDDYFGSNEDIMAKVYRLYVGILSALALCEWSLAGWNTTGEAVNQMGAPCRRRGNSDNCTAPTSDTGQWNGHFTKCPQELNHYCIHGECRFVKDQKAASCRCQHGYIGSRCEYVDLDWRRGDKRQMIIICVIAALVVLILLIVFVFVCSHRRSRCCRKRGRRREEPRNGMEKLHMMDTNSHPVTPDSREPLNANDV